MVEEAVGFEHCHDFLVDDDDLVAAANCEDLNRPEQMRTPWFLIFFFFIKFDGSFRNMVENHTKGIPEPRKKGKKRIKEEEEES